VQGKLYSMPVPADEVAALLDELALKPGASPDPQPVSD